MTKVKAKMNIYVFWTKKKTAAHFSTFNFEIYSGNSIQYANHMINLRDRILPKTSYRWNREVSASILDPPPVKTKVHFVWS